MPGGILVFTVGSATNGMADEYLPFVPVLIVLAHALGYDAVTLGEREFSFGAMVDRVEHCLEDEIGRARAGREASPGAGPTAGHFVRRPSSRSGAARLRRPAYLGAAAHGCWPHAGCRQCTAGGR